MPKHNPLMQFKAINKPDPKETTDEAIKKLVIDTLGTGGTVKLTPETLDSNLSLRELGATSDDMRALLRALDDKYKLGNSEARRSPDSYSAVESLESALKPFFDSHFLSQHGGIDIDTVGKIKKILQTGRATETKNWWNKYPSYSDLVRKLDPFVSPYGRNYLDLDEYEGFPTPLTDEDYERYWLGLNIYTDKEKDQLALQLVEKLFEKRWLKSDKSVLNQYLKSKALVTDADKQDMLFRTMFKLHEKEDYPYSDEFKNKERLLLDSIFKLPMNKKSMPYFINYVDKLPTLPFLKSAGRDDMYELPIRNKIDKKKVTDENIKRIILLALGNKGALKLKPEDLQGDTSLMELGARRKNIWDLGKLLDKEFKPDGVDYDYDPYEKEGTPYPYFQQSGIDIDSVNKIKKALLSKSNFVPKGYDDYYDTKYPKYEDILKKKGQPQPGLDASLHAGYIDGWNDKDIYQDVFIPEDAIKDPEIFKLYNLLVSKNDDKQTSLLEKYIKDKLMNDILANNMLGALSLVHDLENELLSAPARLLYNRLKKNNKKINSLNIVNNMYEPSFVNDEEWEDVHRGVGDIYE